MNLCLKEGEESCERKPPPHHEIDEKATLENATRLREAIGDITEVNVDRSPVYRFWGGDLSTDLGHLRGIENIMLDMLDNPKWLHWSDEIPVRRRTQGTG